MHPFSCGIWYKHIFAWGCNHPFCALTCLGVWLYHCKRGQKLERKIKPETLLQNLNVGREVDQIAMETTWRSEATLAAALRGGACDYVQWGRLRAAMMVAIQNSEKTRVHLFLENIFLSLFPLLIMKVPSCFQYFACFQGFIQEIVNIVLCIKSLQTWNRLKIENKNGFNRWYLK